MVWGLGCLQWFKCWGLKLKVRVCCGVGDYVSGLGFQKLRVFFGGGLCREFRGTAFWELGLKDSKA